jgi:uncharacterized protein YjbI with pentapeptide repeats
MFTKECTMKSIGVDILNLPHLQPGRSPKFFLTQLAIFFLAVWLAVFGAIAPVQAANPDHVTQLLETKACPGCDLQAADLRGVNLRGSNLEGANLEGAYLMATNLRAANLKHANLKSARLYAAVLTDADLRDAATQSIQLSSATICHTRIPSGELSNRDCDRYSG